jgi:hypothetical protein
VALFTGRGVDGQSSTWFSPEAWTGRWTIWAFGWALLSRPAAARLGCEAPLSTTQDTRLAEAYGSVLMTWSARAVNGFSAVDGSHRPMTRAR